MITPAQILFIDCQSTGSSPASSALLEIGVNNDAWVIRQGQPVPGRVLRLVGLSQRDVDAGVSEEQVFSAVSGLVSNVSAAFGREAFAVAHFARFEALYLDRLWQKFSGHGFPLPLICTHKLTKLLHPRLPNYGLRALAGWFGLPLGEGKRAAHHVEATKDIWRALSLELVGRGVTTREALQSFCDQKVQKSQGRREFMIPRERRLGLPNEPGIYKYIDRSGRVLYVGKATSLKSRVNSYFTGGCRGDHRKLEMLAQAVDVDVTPLATPLCAGLLEYDEIRRLNPPYNIAFKGRGRQPEDALDLLVGDSEKPDLERLKPILAENFYGLSDRDVLFEGLLQWRRQRGVDAAQVLTRRDLLNLGVPLLKVWIAAEKQRRAALAMAMAIDDASAETDAPAEDLQSDDLQSDEPEALIWTPDMVAETCERIVRRGTRHYVRLRWLKRIAGATIQYDPGGSIQRAKKKDSIGVMTLEPQVDGEVFDPRRVKVLLHELRRGAAKGGSWKILTPWPMSIPFWI